MKPNVPERAVFAVEVSKFVLKGHIIDVWKLNQRDFYEIWSWNYMFVFFS